jgi:isocitrate dehydrogenase
MDVVIVRENEEDLYAGIEYRQTKDVVEAMKIISRPGSEKIVRYAFEYAVRNNRKKVTCFTKDNIMKLSDGLFHKVFDEIGEDYPQIEKEHWIVDIGAAKLADTPEIFDVVVMPNLYGDILSDVAAQIAGSVGLAGSANIGEQTAMFEAIHGSAPRRANQNVANPSGLLLGAIMMLVHIDQSDVAERVHNAWLKTLEDGIHTYDIYDERVSRQKVGTKEFAQAVVARLGQKPSTLREVTYGKGSKQDFGGRTSGAKGGTKEAVGIDVYLDWNGSDANELSRMLKQATGESLRLQMITNRGVQVWPQGFPETFVSDHWRCRFLSQTDKGAVTHQQMAELLARLAGANFDFVKTNTLFTFDGQMGYTLSQGE